MPRRDRFAEAVVEEQADLRARFPDVPRAAEELQAQLVERLPGLAVAVTWPTLERIDDVDVYGLTVEVGDQVDDTHRDRLFFQVPAEGLGHFGPRVMAQYVAGHVPVLLEQIRTSRALVPVRAAGEEISPSTENAKFPGEP